MTDTANPLAAHEALIAKLPTLQERMGEVIQGKPETIEILLVSFLAGGSALIEDVPGVGKTTLAKALSSLIDAEFKRVQFTPDLLPADILGGSVYNPTDGAFHFRKGPIFCQVLLADEINRASPRTQSALLEAMSEQQVSIEGTTYPLPSPFFVLATQNPIEFHGTYPLPEAQLDRFLSRIEIGYPSDEVEVDILYAQQNRHPVERLEPLLHADDCVTLMRAVRDVSVDRSLAEYLVAIVNATRRDERLELGCSPRGSLMLFRACQSRALIQGRDYVLPDDIQQLAVAVLAHRIAPTTKTRYSGMEGKALIQEILNQIPVPS
ncbi:MAG: MoxR family ATPase [Candidatus Omnitrophica bacterium]|nr:MoxR family ATPase [Candidatus Omnitrophota bacterium]